jgi:HAD superfamily hydrolase (TIGR01549 family)
MVVGEKAMKNPVLVVDLDGTLVDTDLLHETFWSAFANRWTVPFHSLRALAFGRPQLKRYLAGVSSVDVALLPYNKAVIEYIEQWRSRGGRTALVTATDQNLADRIAAHLGLFDDVYGSDGSANLKGDHKAAFLTQEYADTGFAYMGDADADLPVWQMACKAITVNAGENLERRVAALDADVEHLASGNGHAGAYFKALRAHQWLKNMLVFVPMIAAHQLKMPAFTHSLLAFLAFSLVASSAYLVNDMLDLDADRAHPRKRYRALASGALPIGHAAGLAVLLLVGGLILATLLSFQFVLVMLGYYVGTTAYSFYLKRRLIIDIFTLAALYTTRIVAGAVATDIGLSVWLLAFSMFFFFSLAAIKRQAELVDGIATGEVSARGRGYHIDDLPIVAAMAVASGYASVLIMALYVNSPGVVQFYSQPEALWGICLVLLYWISRMVMVTHRGRMHDDPIVFAIKDPVSLICAASVTLLAVLGIVL